MQMHVDMNTTAIKGRLHEYIETADNEHLAAIYLLLQKELKEPYLYDTATLSMLYQRLEEDLQGQSKSYTVEEAFAIVRNRKTL